MKLRSLRRRLLWPFTFAAMWLLLTVVRWSPLFVLRLLARVLGNLCYLLPGFRRTALANLRVAFPDWDPARRRLVAKRSMQNMIQAFFEFNWLLPRPGRLDEFVDFPEAVQKALHESVPATGLIACSPHLGNWELGNHLLNTHGLKTHAVARRQPNPFIQKLIQQQRTASGAEVILEKGAAKEILKTLKRGETVIMLVDQNTKPHDGGVFVDFFGLPAAMSRAPAMFARRTGAPLVVAVCVRQDSGRYLTHAARVQIDPAADEPALCAAINRLSEEFIRQYPEQYLWAYGRYRYIPSDWTGDRGRFPAYSTVYKTGD